MRRAIVFIPAWAAALWASGCASDRAAPLEPESIEIVETAEAPIDPALIAGPPVDFGAAAPSPEAQKDPGEDQKPQSAPAEGSFWRADGRPAWWLEAPHRVGGRVAVTVEALGADVGEARARAIESGHAALRRATGPAPGGVRLESMLLRRLEGDAPGRARYVAYARLSAREPEPGGP
ncbi:MAG: hypothetical protein IBJ10_09115 [Phycisphaerales bacterium]|nr:hypothetical protein [Phycisphaerales bacterium]